MGSYFLIDEHEKQPTAVSLLDGGSNSDYLSVSPHWILMVVRYREPVTSSKTRLANRTKADTGDVSQDEDSFRLTNTKAPLIITSSCVSMDITSSKNNYTQNLNAVLKAGQYEFLSAIMPGDWCLCWVMNTKEKYLQVLDKIRNGDKAAEDPERAPGAFGANGFSDGLKFVGRVHDIRKVLTQSPEGLRTVQYNLAGVGFGELDSSIFFDPALARKESYLARFLSDMGILLREVYQEAAKDSNGAGGISANKIIPRLLTAFLGEGLSGVSVASGGLTQATGAAAATKEAPFAYVIPDKVANVLGVRTPSKGVFCYADILEVIIGLQKYNNDNFPELFYPAGTSKGKPRNRHTTDEPLKGLFLPVPTSFSNKSLWNILNEYLNPAINEMYTAMKYTPSGRVMPTLVVRQLPFSSPILHQKFKTQVTAFHELPRWVADPLLVRALDVGRSDAARTNFVHIYAQVGKKIMASEMATQIVRWPPLSDPQDIKRHGLRPHMGTIQSAAIDNDSGGPGLWMTIKSDFLFGQHMMLNGTVSLFGVTLPIVPGDNFEFDDILYHIEAVNHHVEIQPDGKKTFTTQLTLTHGMRADVPKAVDKFSPERKQTTARSHVRENNIEIADKRLDKKSKKGDEAPSGTITETGPTIEVGSRGENLDIYLYSGIDADDNRGLEPGIFVDDEVDEGGKPQ